MNNKTNRRTPSGMTDMEIQHHLDEYQKNIADGTVHKAVNQGHVDHVNLKGNMRKIQESIKTITGR